ncbi:HNH endonuclease [Kocuria coralli]|uniref:HNH endonuclease n=1 Tax=Kocuria coralli TaxID=1461025 RepID=UPI001FEB5307|nr:HNH endonuclease signature motif containing protein [Kocuria coralli]
MDHTIPWATGGTTASTNLAHLCRHHHRVKHEATALGAWQVRHINPHTAEPFTTIPENTSARGVSGQQHPADQRAPAGVLEWTSPTGTVRRTVPGAATPITTTWLTGHALQPGPADHAHDRRQTVEKAPGPSAEDPPPF